MRGDNGRKCHVRSPATTSSAMIYSRPFLNRALAAIIVASLSSVACSRTTGALAASPLKQANQMPRNEPVDDLDVERRHLAPPPAYGNKVVIARAHQTTTPL